jgi:hypothetical protein
MHENEKDEIIDKLHLKVVSIKNELDEIRSYKIKKYDYFKLKNIIKENLQEEKNKKDFLFKDKSYNNDVYDVFLNEKININSYSKNIEESNDYPNVLEFNNDNTIDIDEINRLEINAINKAKELGIKIS